MDDGRIILPVATAEDLEKIGKLLGMSRRRYFFIFKESDKKYRARILDKIYGGKFKHFSIEGRYRGDN